MVLLSKIRGCVFDILFLLRDNHCYKTNTIECFGWFLFIFRAADVGSSEFVVYYITWQSWVGAGLNTCFRLLLRNIPTHTPKHNMEYHNQDYNASCTYGSKFTAVSEIESLFSLVLKVYRHSSISAVSISAVFDLPWLIMLSYFPPH